MHRRRPLLTWAWHLASLGVAHLFWLARLTRELGAFDARLACPPRRVVVAVAPGGLLIVPALLAYHRIGRRIVAAQRAAGLPHTCSPARGVVLACALGAVTAYYQAEVNKIVDAYGFEPGIAVPLYA